MEQGAFISAEAAASILHLQEKEVIALCEKGDLHGALHSPVSGEWLIPVSEVANRTEKFKVRKLKVDLPGLFKSHSKKSRRVTALTISLITVAATCLTIANETGLKNAISNKIDDITPHPTKPYPPDVRAMVSPDRLVYFDNIKEVDLDGDGINEYCVLYHNDIEQNSDGDTDFKHFVVLYYDFSKKSWSVFNPKISAYRTLNANFASFTGDKRSQVLVDKTDGSSASLEFWVISKSLNERPKIMFHPDDELGRAGISIDRNSIVLDGDEKDCVYTWNGSSFEIKDAEPFIEQNTVVIHAWLQGHKIMCDALNNHIYINKSEKVMITNSRKGNERLYDWTIFCDGAVKQSEKFGIAVPISAGEGHIVISMKEKDGVLPISVSVNQ